MENMNLIRKIAWSFHRTTGLPIDELIGEASLAYAEHLPNYKPEVAKITTFMYPRIKCHLIEFCKEEKKIQFNPLGELPPADKRASQENRTAFKQALKGSSEEVQALASIIFQSPEEFLGVGGRGRVKERLREYGWTWSMIWRSFFEIKKILKKFP